MAKLIVAFIAGLVAAVVAAFIISVLEDDPLCNYEPDVGPMSELEFNDGVGSYSFRGKLTGYDPNVMGYGTFSESSS